MRSPALTLPHASRRVLVSVVSAVVLAATLASHADLWDRLGLKRSGATDAASGLLGQALSNDQVVGGLKEALGNGVSRAIQELGKNDGFLTNLAVRIPMPESLQKAERLLRSVGQEEMADKFVSSMNRAAERAVPEAAAVFKGAISQMSIADAKAILDGPKDAATKFFEKSTRTNLQARFLPLVQKATSEVGATADYKALTSRLSSLDSVGGGLFGGFRKKVVSDQSLDLDAYVTDKALDGLFTTIADEEKRIRENPVARSTELLQRVFGGSRK